MKARDLERPRSAGRWPTLAVAMLAAVGLAACHQSEGPAEGGAAAGARKAPTALPVVTADGGDYVLRYFSPTSGQLIVARKLSEIPEGARAQVLVVPDDAALRGPWLFVADLSAKDAKTFEVRVVDRFELEQKVAAAQPKPEAPAAAAPSAAGLNVVVYRTAWCGYCKKAAEYLRLKQVPFVEKDIERDPGARQDMMARAARAGVPASSLQGVPIIAIGDRVLSGFNRDAIDAALAGR